MLITLQPHQISLLRPVRIMVITQTLLCLNQYLLTPIRHKLFATITKMTLAFRFSHDNILSMWTISTDITNVDNIVKFFHFLISVASIGGKYSIYMSQYDGNFFHL